MQDALAGMLARAVGIATLMRWAELCWRRARARVALLPGTDASTRPNCMTATGRLVGAFHPVF